MRISTCFALATSLLCATALHAQDAAVEDASRGDAAVVEDASPSADAAVVEDAAAVADAAAGSDSALGEDASAVEDASATADAAVMTDAGADDASTGPGCGDVSFFGECDGDTVRYCASDNHVVEIDCSADFGSDATCGLADCADGDDCMGYYCVASSGTACDALGCDVSAGEGCIDGTCQASTTCDPASFSPSCDGDTVTYCAFTVGNSDCSEGGSQPYTCGDGPDNSPACVGTATGLCNIETGHGCVDGLDCVGGVCVEPGSDAGVLDAGAPDGASINPVKDEDPGCGCSAQHAGAAGSALLLLGLATLFARRRR